MTTVTTGVVAHIQRRDMANELAEQIGAAYISIDDGSLGFGNHVRVWRHLAEQGTDWCLAVEDDAIPVIDFTHHLHNALRHAPHNCPVVSLYLGTGPRMTQRVTDAVDKAKANDAAWIESAYLLHAVAVAVRTDYVPTMCDYVTRKRYLPIDDAISSWRARHLQGHKVAYTMPSLVDHRDTPTVIDRHRDGRPRNYPRKAICVGARQNWDTTTVIM